MEYREAFKIGTRCDGYIKARYATIYSKDHNALFSLQRLDFSTTSEAREKGNDIGFLYGGVRIDNTQQLTQKINDRVYVDQVVKVDLGGGKRPYVVDISKDPEVEILMDVPVVVAERFVEIKEKNDFVPVVITDVARDRIISVLNTIKTTKYIVYKYYMWGQEPTPAHPFIETIEPGGKKKVLETYDFSEAKKLYDTRPEPRTKNEYRDISLFSEDKWYYIIEFVKVLDPKYQELIESIESDAEFEVKANVIDWVPADVENATVIEKGENGEEYELNLDDAIAAAEERLNKAKAILIAAGFTNII